MPRNLLISKVLLSTLAVAALLASGCQSIPNILESNPPTTSAESGVSSRDTITKPTKVQRVGGSKVAVEYDQAQDLRYHSSSNEAGDGVAITELEGALDLEGSPREAQRPGATRANSTNLANSTNRNSSGLAANSASATTATTSSAGTGELFSDAYVGVINMDTNPEAVRQGVALSSRLEEAPISNDSQLGAADPYLSVKEMPLSPNEARPRAPTWDNNALLAANNANDRNSNSTNIANNISGNSAVNTGYMGNSAVGNGVNSNSTIGSSSTQASASPNTVSEIGSLNRGTCSTSLSAEVSGLARAIARELANRLRNENGSVFVAPSIIDREYADCVRDFSAAIRDGISGASNFTIAPATTNLNNIVSQNIGSATILPSLIHQSRAAHIPYLIISQISKTGGNAALTLRVIRTQDGITLGQTFRRLSQ